MLYTHFYFHYFDLQRHTHKSKGYIFCESEASDQWLVRKGLLSAGCPISSSPNWRPAKSRLPFHWCSLTFWKGTCQKWSLQVQRYHISTPLLACFFQKLKVATYQYHDTVFFKIAQPLTKTHFESKTCFFFSKSVVVVTQGHIVTDYRSMEIIFQYGEFME